MSKRALVLIDSLESDKQSYGSAKALLESAFASTPVQVFNTIKQISQMNLPSNQDPFEYVSKTRQVPCRPVCDRGAIPRRRKTLMW